MPHTIFMKDQTSVLFCLRGSFWLQQIFVLFPTLPLYWVSSPLNIVPTKNREEKNLKKKLSKMLIANCLKWKVTQLPILYKSC